MGPRTLACTLPATEWYIFWHLIFFIAYKEQVDIYKVLFSDGFSLAVLIGAKLGFKNFGSPPRIGTYFPLWLGIMASEMSVVRGHLVDLASQQAPGDGDELTYDEIVAYIKSKAKGRVKAGWFRENWSLVRKMYLDELALLRPDPMISGAGSEGNSVRGSSSSASASDGEDDSSSSNGDSDSDLDLEYFKVSNLILRR